MKVLIIDDDADDRLLLREYLQGHGFAVAEAINGEDGLCQALAFQPDAILSDVLMPKMDGLQFLRHLKQDAALRHIHVILYTAKFTGEDEKKFAESLGACAYIVRPDTVGELHARLKTAIDGCRQSCPPEVASGSYLTTEEYHATHSRIISAKLHEKMQQLQEATEKHRQAEEFIHNILESIDEGFAVIGPDYKVILANKWYCCSLKQRVEEIKGNFCYEVSHQLRQPCFMEGQECAVRETFRTGTSHSGMHVHTDSDGKPMYVEIKSYPMTDATGAIISVIETVNDITEKRKLEEQLYHAQKMESVGRLAGGVAHDFNNFLSIIIGYGTLLEMNIPKDSPLRADIREILNAGDRAATLTKSLLAFSRKQPSNPMLMDLNDTISVIGKLLAKLVGEDIEINVTLSAQKLFLMADSGQISQVLMNLATNARDAMPNRGRLTISTDSIHLSPEFVQAHGYGEPGMYALLAVTDTGTGMDEEVRSHIFDPFFTTKEEGKGTGLGLSIVYGIVKQHNGYINVYSEPGLGTTFKIYLPLLQSAGEKEQGEVRSALQGGTETVLIAEDDGQVRSITRDILEGYGYKVIEAEDGEAAVDQFTRHAESIDLLLFDVMMPKANGWEAYQEITELRPGVPILFMSGYPMDVIRSKGILTSEENYLTKPVSPEELLRRVREVLDKKAKEKLGR